MDKVVGQNVDNAVKKVGFMRVKWMPCVNLSLGLMLFLNCTSCFDRADYVTTLAGILAIYFLNDTSDIDRRTFRYVPIAFLVAIIYDIIYLFLL